MPIKSPNEDEGFYDELDKKKSHSSCCTCQTLSILFVAVLLLLAGLIFYIYWQVTREKVFPQNPPSVAALEQFQNKFTNQIANTDGLVQIPITEQELTSLLAEGFSDGNLKIKEVQVAIFPSQMLIYGTLTKPLTSKVAITAVPQAEAGKIKFNITNISAGSFNLPSVISSRVSQSLSSAINGKLAPMNQNFYIETITLQEKKMILVGKKQ